MKILVPSDFSRTSNNAALYAAKFAKIVHAEIILLHVVHFVSPPMVQVSGLVEEEIEEIRISDASRDYAHLVDELKSKVKGVKVSFKIVEECPIADAIEDYASANKVDLIIMGTNGASGIQKMLFGSNAVAVINKSTIPVITVPEYSRFTGLKHIVYASDMHAMKSEIQKIIPFAKQFEASIAILHVLPSNSKKKIDSDSVKNDLIEKCKYQKISLHIVHNDDIIEGINDFIADTKADLLAMHTYEMGFFDNFLKTSFSREEAFHSLIPLLTFKR